jgi:CPA2 family monovalent cation:H+ antiporter-2
MVLLKDLIIILCLAVIIIIITSKLKIPPIIGFLLTGIIIGPSAFHLIETFSEIEILAEIGIILLMFTIGLEFSLSKIREMKKNFFYFGGLQISISWLVFFYLLQWYGLTFQQCLFGGFILSLSSTVIVLKLLKDNDEINTPFGLKMTGILLFQDAALIPFLIIIPSIYVFSEALSVQTLYKTAISFGGVVTLFFLSIFLLPKIFKVIVKTRIPELLIVTVLVIVFGSAFATYQLGASLAIGAFIAGVAISDCEYSHQINTEIIPSRHIFNSIFFISIGMFINIPFLLSHLSEVILFTIVLIVLKGIIILIIFIISKYPINEGIITAFGLAHTGEFSFIILKLSQQYNLFPEDTYQVLLSCSILSMFTIPFAMIIGKKVSGLKKLKKKFIPETKPSSLKNHTIIAGFGVNGQNIARILKLLDVPYAIIDINPVTVSHYKPLGEPIYYGDIDREDNLKSIGITKASLLVIAISDMEACQRAIKLSKNLNPSLRIIARSNFLTQVEEMYNLGADLVLSQDMETSLIFINHILKFYNLPDHVARIQTNLLRKEHYKFFMKDEFKESWKVAVLDFIAQDNELFFIGRYSKHVSKKISELEVYKFEDVMIIGVIRKNEVITQSLEDLTIQKYDSILFSGIHKKVFLALEWMEENN